MENKTRKKTAIKLKTSTIMEKPRKKEEQVVININNASLTDVVRVSRVVEARIKGLDVSTINLSGEAERIIASVKVDGKVFFKDDKATLRKLNNIIVSKNEIDNKPSKRSIKLYRKLILET